MSYEHRRREETRKYLRKSCYHRIKCTVTTFLAAFMWRRHLNNEALATTTHRKPGEVFNGTSTQVISQTIDKCRVKMIKRELYNVKNLLWKQGKSGEQAYLQFVCSQNWSIWIESPLNREFVPICLWSLIQIFLELVIIVAQTHQSPVFQPTLYKFILLGSLGHHTIRLGHKLSLTNSIS